MTEEPTIKRITWHKESQEVKDHQKATNCRTRFWTNSDGEVVNSVCKEYPDCVVGRLEVERFGLQALLARSNEKIGAAFRAKYEELTTC